MNGRNSDLLVFLKTLYIPASKEERFEFVWDWVKSQGVKLREISEADEYRGDVDILVITTKGKPGREVFQDYQIKKAQFAKVGKAYAELYIFDAETGLGYPAKVYYKNPKISIITK